MRLDEQGRPVYVGERRAAIAAWFDETLQTATTIDLCCRPQKLFGTPSGA